MAAHMDREKAVEQAISQIEKQFGRGSIMKMGEERILDIPAISTGSLALDLALGIGGVPRGRVIEIYGPEASGKTTLALHVAAEAQAIGGMVAFIDAEHALDVGYARKLGVDVDSLLVSQPDTGEQALDIAEILVRSGAIDMLVIDGPSGFTQKHTRYPALPMLYDRLSHKSVIYLDDAARDDEKEIVDMWLSEYPSLSHAHIETERGCSLLSVHKS